MATDTEAASGRLRAAGDALYRAAGIEVDHHEDEVEGLPTHWVTAGRVESPHAVLLHGSGGSAALWYPTLADLARRRHVIAVDMPGHGETSVPLWNSPATIERMLRWLDTFLERFEWPLVIGHSLGGFMAVLHFARRRPNLAGLVLVDSGGIGPRPPGFVMATRHPVLGASSALRPAPARHGGVWKERFEGSRSTHTRFPTARLHSTTHCRPRAGPARAASSSRSTGAWRSTRRSPITGFGDG